jgi:hypothetical protein
MVKNHDVDVTDIDEYLRTAPETYKRCRAIGHVWIEQHEGWLRPTADEPWRIELKCERCGGDGRLIPDPNVPGQFRRTSKLDPDYYIKGARLGRNDVRSYLLEQAQHAVPPRTPRRSRRR